MGRAFRGTVNVDIRDSVPDWEPFLQPKAPPGASNVLMIVWDDVGYGAMDVHGGPIETPTMRRIADAGLRYSNFHTTALCSPTRSSLLNGRNATSNNMACIAEASAGFPGFSARIPFENGTIAEVLNERGWNTYAIGIQQVTSESEIEPGTRVFTAEFQKTGEDATGSATGTLTLYVDMKPVGSAEIMTQPGNFALTGDGLCIGRDSASAVSPDYPPPYALVGGTIGRVVIDVSGEHYVDHEKEVLA
jgi:hypothetical protein